MTEYTSTYKPMLWDKNLVNNFRIKNPDKKIGVITWTQDRNKMKSQLLTCIGDEVDIILSEVVPGDIQDNILNKEFEFFCKHYLYVPPRVTEIDTTDNKCGTILIILDKEIKPKQLFWNKITPILKEIERIKIFYINKCNIEYDKLTKELVECEKIIINCSNPHISLYCILYGLVKGKNIFIENAEVIATRLWALELTGFEIDDQDFKNISLRSRIHSIIDQNIRTNLNSKILNEIEINFKDVDKFKEFFERNNCQDFLYDLNSGKLKELGFRYMDIIHLYDKTNKSIEPCSRFYILHFLNILENQNINIDIRRIVLEYILVYISKGNNTVIQTNSILYQLFKIYNHELKSLITKLTKWTESEELQTYCYNIAESLYLNSLNQNISDEKRNYLQQSAIILLKSLYSNNPKGMTHSKTLFEYLIMDNPSKIACCKENIAMCCAKINSNKNTIKSSDIYFTEKMLDIYTVDFIDYIKENNLKSIDSSLHNKIVFGLLYKIGLHPRLTYYNTVPNFKKFHNIFDDLKFFLNLGFSSLPLVTLLRHALTLDEIVEKSIEFNELQKSLLLLHCLDRPDSNTINHDLYKTYSPDQSKVGLSIHYAIQILLKRFSNKKLEPNVVHNIKSHIDSLCPTQDVVAYAYAYFLAKSVDHKSLNQILIQCETDNYMYYKINSYLENLASRDNE